MTVALPMKSQDSYTLTELSALAGVGQKRLREVLRGSGISSRRIHGRCRIFVSDIQARLPELWDSIVIVVRVRATDENSQG